MRASRSPVRRCASHLPLGAERSRSCGVRAEWRHGWAREGRRFRARRGRLVNRRSVRLVRQGGQRARQWSHNRSAEHRADHPRRRCGDRSLRGRVPVSVPALVGCCPHVEGPRRAREYNGAPLALAPAVAGRFIGEGVIAPCSTCVPPCGSYHVSADRDIEQLTAAFRAWAAPGPDRARPRRGRRVPPIGAGSSGSTSGPDGAPGRPARPR
jgi:hypothetical protein